jgi:hypothetical protein
MRRRRLLAAQAINLNQLPAKSLCLSAKILPRDGAGVRVRRRARDLELDAEMRQPVFGKVRAQSGI